jgi:hypothetical protein
MLHHLSRMVPGLEVLTSLTSSTCSGSMILSCVTWTLLDLSSNYNDFHRSQVFQTRCSWLEEVRNINDSSKTWNDRRLEIGESCSVIVAAFSIGLPTVCDQLCSPNVGAITKIYL